MSGKNKNKKSDGNQSVFTKETLGVTCILFSALIFVFLITGEAVFGKLGAVVNAFLYGVFGMAAYPVAVYGIIGGFFIVTDKKSRLSKRFRLFFTLSAICIVAFVHVLKVGDIPSYGEYLSRSYNMGADGFSKASGGGFFTALFAYFFSRLTVAGGAVVLAVLACACIYFTVTSVVGKKKDKSDKEKDMGGVYVQPTEPVPQTIAEPTAIEPERKRPETSHLFVSGGDDFALKTKREVKKGTAQTITITSDGGGMPIGNVGKSYEAARLDDLQKKLDYIKIPAPIDLSRKDVTTVPKEGETEKPAQYASVSGVIPKNPEPPKRAEDKPALPPMIEHDGVRVSGIRDDASARSKEFEKKYGAIDEPSVPQKREEPKETFRSLERGAGRDLFADKKEKPADVPPVEDAKSDRRSSIFGAKETERELPKTESAENTENKEQPAATESRITRDRKISEILFGDNDEKKEERAATSGERGFTSRVEKDGNAPTSQFGSTARGMFETKESSVPETPSITVVEEPEKPKKVVPINREYFRPPLDLLETYAQTVDASEENHEEKLETIRQTLEDFHIQVDPQGFVQGPSITRYEIKMPAGISVNKVSGYDKDLKMRLASRNDVRIEAPIPGKDLVGIEVANKHRVTVGLKEVLEGASGRKTKKGELIFALGKDIVGNAITDNLAKGPHYLVAGATGSGKSVCLNVMLISLVMRYSPEDLRLILIDPKRVGFRIYEHLPHLLIDEIITEPQRCLAVLAWAYEEMERRYKLFEECDEVLSDINGYNDYIERTAKDTTPRLARIVIVVDELADLMETCKKDLDARIRALAAKARAAGIHLVLATQRPSVDVITGTIKANLPSRIALKVMNFVDSQTILSEAGAEKLLGNGDMLYKNSAMPECERYQGAWISDREINNVVSYIIEHNEAYFDDELTAFLDKETKPKQEESVASSDDGGEEEFDDLFLKALALAINTGTASISQFQRRFQIGYARAGGIVDKMERYGFISGNEGSKARKVLIPREEYEQRFGPMPDTF